MGGAVLGPGPARRYLETPYMTSNANITGAPTGTVVTLHAVVQRADGTVEDLGVIATSDPEHTPVTPRKDNGPKQG